jgi:sugar/nucleoside kinase (ribokinase family)
VSDTGWHRTAHVVVVGDIVTDVVVRTAAEIAHGSDTAASIRMTGGGAAANTAAWLAHAGTTSTLIGRVGADAAGHARLAELEAAGVRCAVARDPVAPTGTIVVLVGPDGERSMLPDRGASALLTPEDVDAGVAAAVSATPTARHLHLSGYCLLDPSSRPAGLRALAAARAAGLTTSVDAASAAPLRATGPATFLGWITGTDLLLANAEEAAVLAGLAPDATESGDADAAAARTLLSTARTIVVKRGPRGALWCSPSELVSLKARPAVQSTPIDSTGAGDAFAAGLLAARLDGAEPTAALQAGIEFGALAIGTLGGRPERPS